MLEPLNKEEFKYIPDFGWFPRVTNILKVISKGKGYDNWLMNKGKEAKDILSDAGDIGTSLHQRLEEIGKGIQINTEALKPLERKWVGEFSAWKEQNIDKFLETEHTVWHNVEEYCGTLDALVLLKDKRVAVLDYKTSRYTYDTHFLQTTAYLKAYELLHQIKIDTAFILRFDKYGKDMEVTEVPEIPYQWQTFLSALNIWKWRYHNQLLRQKEE